MILTGGLCPLWVKSGHRDNKPERPPVLISFDPEYSKQCKLGFPQWPFQVDDDGSAKHFPQQFERNPARQVGLRSLTLALRRHLDAGVHEYVPGNFARHDRIVQFLVRHGDQGLEQHDQGPGQGQEHIRKSISSGIAECRH